MIGTCKWRSEARWVGCFALCGIFSAVEWYQQIVTNLADVLVGGEHLIEDTCQNGSEGMFGDLDQLVAKVVSATCAVIGE